MAGKFELTKSKGEQYHFNLKAENGEIIFSSEMYNSKSAAEKGIESVKRNAGDEKSYERRTNVNSQPFFVLKSGNAEEIGMSEMYSSDSARENGIKSLMKNAPDASISDLAQ
jgi:uncharacterized protein YegP (UPF0339 family)